MVIRILVDEGAGIIESPARFAHFDQDANHRHSTVTGALSP
jgi:hypothetical protein